jgi:methylenetetrahydrofolate dehydrogenase (NADP+)/methenyltetrahydrofolate cyclohydrolase
LSNFNQMVEYIDMSEILRGTTINEGIAQTLIQKIEQFKIKPKLVIIQLGNKEESNTYIRHKMAFAEKVGVTVEYRKYEENVAQEQVLEDIENYNINEGVDGIIIQLPMPEHFDTTTVLESIDSKKDVDGLTSASLNSLLRNEPGFVSGATKAVLTILDSEHIEVEGKKVVIVGHSALVGKPTALAMINRNATVTVCHAFTKNLTEETKRADILITAVGKPHLITSAHVAPGQIVIDIGITVGADKKVVGDVDYEQVKDTVGAITPVPGGIGPLSIACLFENVVEAAIKNA